MLYIVLGWALPSLIRYCSGIYCLVPALSTYCIPFDIKYKMAEYVMTSENWLDMMVTHALYCPVDLYNMYTIYNLPDVHWHVINNIMSQYYLCFHHILWDWEDAVKEQQGLKLLLSPQGWAQPLEKHLHVGLSNVVIGWPPLLSAGVPISTTESIYGLNPTTATCTATLEISGWPSCMKIITATLIIHGVVFFTVSYWWM